jgi:hypothetical protein
VSVRVARQNEAARAADARRGVREGFVAWRMR